MALVSAINSGGGNCAEKVARTGLLLPVLPLALAFSILGDLVAFDVEEEEEFPLLNNLLRNEFFRSKDLLALLGDAALSLEFASVISFSSGTSLTRSEASFLVNLKTNKTNKYTVTVNSVFQMLIYFWKPA